MVLRISGGIVLNVQSYEHKIFLYYICSNMAILKVYLIKGSGLPLGYLKLVGLIKRSEN